MHRDLRLDNVVQLGLRQFRVIDLESVARVSEDALPEGAGLRACTPTPSTTGGASPPSRTCIASGCCWKLPGLGFRQQRCRQQRWHRACHSLALRTTAPQVKRPQQHMTKPPLPASQPPSPAVPRQV